MEEYLTVKELSSRIKVAPGTIRNMVWKKIFRANVHYLKPGRKIIFIWSAVEAWLRQESAVSTRIHHVSDKFLIK